MIIETKKKYNLRYILNTRRFLAMMVGVVVLSIGMLIFVLLPQITSVTELLSELDSTNTEVQNLELKVNQLNNLPNSDLLAQKSKIDRILPSKKPLLDLLSAFEQVAAKTDVTFSDVSLSPGLISTDSAQLDPKSSANARLLANRRKSSDYDQIDLDLKVVGTFVNINLFLQEIEKVAPMTTITSMSLREKNVANSDGQNVLNFEAELVTTSYFYTKSVSSSVRSPLPELNSDQMKILADINSFYIPNISEQTRIQGGGLEDLFGINVEQEVQTETGN